MSGLGATLHGASVLVFVVRRVLLAARRSPAVALLMTLREVGSGFGLAVVQCICGTPAGRGADTRTVENSTRSEFRMNVVPPSRQPGISCGYFCEFYVYVNTGFLFGVLLNQCGVKHTVALVVIFSHAMDCQELLSARPHSPLPLVV